MENWMTLSFILVIMLAGVTAILNIHSNTLVSYPSTISIYQDKNLNNNYPISPKEAISIANNNIPAFGEVRYGVTVVVNNQNPYYVVTMYNNNPNDNKKVITTSMVDAKTGQFLGASVPNSKNK